MTAAMAKASLEYDIVHKWSSGLIDRATDNRDIVERKEDLQRTWL
jgi:hypothetical protein